MKFLIWFLSLSDKLWSSFIPGLGLAVLVLMVAVDNEVFSVVAAACLWSLTCVCVLVELFGRKLLGRLSKKVGVK